MRCVCRLISTAFVVFALAASFGRSEARAHSRQTWSQMQANAAKRFHQRAPAPAVGRRAPKNITFSNPKASRFYVDGRSIPEVDWDVGPSWSGLLPISNKTDETRKLFFWFFPPGPQGSADDLVFWTNGGPGCSSLEGFLQENGPISWQWGQAKPTINKYSWTNLSSMLWVEQPVGTGFSQGAPLIQNQAELAEELVGFMQQFLEVFHELKGNKLYLTGESYAGQYVPYIADYIYEHPGALDLDLQGIWLGNPALSWDVVQSDIPAVDFVHKYENVFAFNQSFMAHLDERAKSCGFADYMTTHVTYPPRGPLPVPAAARVNGKGLSADECSLWYEIATAALETNPAFNIYRVFDTYPVLWDVLGVPGTFPQVQSPIYFDRADVKRAIHAPTDSTWSLCAPESVFVGEEGDRSAWSSFAVLPKVLERSQRSVIVHGLADYTLLADGTRIAIQNMTWSGKQGFQTPIQPASFVVDGWGPAVGTVHSERGLTYYEVAQCGHMVPQFSPWSAYQSVQYLLGQRKTP